MPLDVSYLSAIFFMIKLRESGKDIQNKPLASQAILHALKFSHKLHIVQGSYDSIT